MTDRTETLLSELVELQRRQVANQERGIAHQERAIAQQEQSIAIQVQAVARQRGALRIVWILLALLVPMIAMLLLNWIDAARR